MASLMKATLRPRLQGLRVCIRRSYTSETDRIVRELAETAALRLQIQQERLEMEKESLQYEREELERAREALRIARANRAKTRPAASPVSYAEPPAVSGERTHLLGHIPVVKLGETSRLQSEPAIPSVLTTAPLRSVPDLFLPPRTHAILERRKKNQITIYDELGQPKSLSESPTAPSGCNPLKGMPPKEGRYDVGAYLRGLLERGWKLVYKQAEGTTTLGLRFKLPPDFEMDKIQHILTKTRHPGVVIRKPEGALRRMHHQEIAIRETDVDPEGTDLWISRRQIALAMLIERALVEQNVQRAPEAVSLISTEPYENSKMTFTPMMLYRHLTMLYSHGFSVLTRVDDTKWWYIYKRWVFESDIAAKDFDLLARAISQDMHMSAVIDRRASRVELFTSRGGKITARHLLLAVRIENMFLQRFAATGSGLMGLHSTTTASDRVDVFDWQNTKHELPYAVDSLSLKEGETVEEGVKLEVVEEIAGGELDDLLVDPEYAGRTYETLE